VGCFTCPPPRRMRRAVKGKGCSCPFQRWPYSLGHGNSEGDFDRNLCPDYGSIPVTMQGGGRVFREGNLYHCIMEVRDIRPAALTGAAGALFLVASFFSVASRRTAQDPDRTESLEAPVAAGSARVRPRPCSAPAYFQSLRDEPLKIPIALKV
jgi:hypothetical protein